MCTSESIYTCMYMGFPGGSVVKNPPAKQEMQVLSLGRVDPLEKEMQPTPIFFLGNPMDRGAWGATVQRVAKSWT